jgi:hypothetical protein
MTTGYTIRVTTRDGTERKVYQVAIGDENRAREAVRQAAGVPSDALVEIEDELGVIDIKWLELWPGQVVPARLKAL